jgi:hypothetical protein
MKARCGLVKHQRPRAQSEYVGGEYIYTRAKYRERFYGARARARAV